MVGGYRVGGGGGSVCRQSCGRAWGGIGGGRVGDRIRGGGCCEGCEIGVYWVEKESGDCQLFGLGVGLVSGMGWWWAMGGRGVGRMHGWSWDWWYVWGWAWDCSV